MPTWARAVRVKEEQSHASAHWRAGHVRLPGLGVGRASIVATGAVVTGEGGVFEVAGVGRAEASAGQITQDRPAAAGVGVVQDVVDEPVGPVVREEGVADPVGAVGEPGAGEECAEENMLSASLPKSAQPTRNMGELTLTPVRGRRTIYDPHWWAHGHRDGDPFGNTSPRNLR